MVFFHLSSYKDFKHFYLYGIWHEHRDKFKKVLYYQRLVALKKSLFMPLTLLMYALFGEETGIYFADSTALKEIVRTLSGKCYVDRGYLGQNLFQSLWKKGLHLITGIRKNMRNYLLPHVDKILLKKRFIVKTVFGVLKNSMGLEHTRHQSPHNAFVHILSTLVAYSFKKHKPKIKTNLLYP